MAFTTNESNAQVVEVRKLYTGIANLQILAINPNNTELTAIYGRPNKEEPVYAGVSKANNPQIRIDIHAKVLGLSKDTKVRFSFYVENFSTTSKTNKLRYINKFGNTAWAESEAALSEIGYYKNVDSRVCLNGEEEFTKTFLRVAGNVATEGECRIDDWKKIFAGDFSELKAIAKALGANSFKALLCVSTSEDGTKFYQNVYTKYFERSYIESPAQFLATLSGERGECKGDYQNDFNFREYIPTAAAAPKPDTEKSTKINDNF